jgi:hypothetical protein
MRKLRNMVLLISFVFAFVAGINAQESADDQWPKSVTFKGEIFQIYQPQLDNWDGYTLKAHSAIGVQEQADKSRISYGVANFTVNTIVDKDTRIVNLEKLNITNVAFPSETAKEQEYINILKQTVPLQMKSIPLDRLEADLSILEEQKKGDSYELNNTPPKIIFSDKPAVLVNIDGQPVFSPVKGTNLSRVLNTHVLLLKDASGKYYLHVFDGYMEASNLEGPWIVSKTPPKEAIIAEKNIEDVDLLEGGNGQSDAGKPSLAGGLVPQVFVCTDPAELIVTDGQVNFVPLKDTKLLYVSNTTANVFEDMAKQKTYVLVSGRWFRAPSKDGPWEYVPANQLPADFASIPDSSPKENVKASVAGTSQSGEALIANSVPTTTKVDRMAAKMTLEIDGTPDLRPIEGTELLYVFNSSIPVLKTAEGKWYAVYNGIWFTAQSVNGPWTAADSIPAEIYSIPTKSPLHYVTYVKIYNSDPGYIYEGYTPGYYGTAVSADGTVVYGTGYVYSSYIGESRWYSPVDTYGFGTTLCWTPWYGWNYSFGFGWGYGNSWYYPPFQYSGPFYTWRHNFGYRYHPWELSTALNGYNRFNHAPGTHIGFSNLGHFGRTYNSRTGVLITGQAHSIKNVFTTPGFGKHSSNSVIGSMKTGARVTGRSVYGSRSGQVYYYREKGKSGNWNHLGAQPQVSQSAQKSEIYRLNREAGARQQGETRYRSFQNHVNNGGKWAVQGATGKKSDDDNGGHEGGRRGGRSGR